MNKISIIGLGWLGMPLARALSAQGFEVMGTKTSNEGVLIAQRCGINAFQCQMTPEIECDAVDLAELLSAEILIITLPASRAVSESGDYFKAIENLVDSAIASGVKRVIFTSSTSVYGDQNAELNESGTLRPETAAGKCLANIEQWLHDLPNLTVDILRLSGLVGPDRHPGRFLAGRKALQNGSHRINLVHQEDVIRAIITLVSHPSSGSLYNLSASNHPRRDEYYPWVAAQLKLSPPQFIPDSRPAGGKVVNGEAICRELKFSYLYSDPFRMPAN